VKGEIFMMARAFTLMELLVVIAIIAILVALGLPALGLVREQGAETVCQSHLRQLAMVMKTYTSDFKDLFPDPTYIYHSPESFSGDAWRLYPTCCRWHDSHIGLRSALLTQEHPEFRGSLWSYLGDPDIVRCKVGGRANLERGCNNHCSRCEHDGRIQVIPQYTYTMNAFLGRPLQTLGSMATGVRVDQSSQRTSDIHRESQVTRSASEVFLFAEQNSWAINREGRQPLYLTPRWPAPTQLSGVYYREREPGWPGTLRLGGLDIKVTYVLEGNVLVQNTDALGDCFATCHRPKRKDLNTGDSFMVMLDGHTRRITLSDQMRRSRQVPGMAESRLGPGGNLRVAWPVDIPPPRGWENQ
jgi:prepilin-type N-terminal cleavage/methylation domain-containing protein